jgi:hypothetical protein
VLGLGLAGILSYDRGMRRVTIAAVLALAAPAHADKKRETAVALSATGTAVSSGLVLGAFFVGRDTADVNGPLLYAGLGTSVITPSLGELYAGQYLTWGMGIRGGAVALAALAFALPQETVTCQLATMPGQTCDQLSGTAVAVLGLAAIAYIGGAAYDVIDAGDAAGRYNSRHGLTIGVAPGILRTPTGQAPFVNVAGTW